MTAKSVFACLLASVLLAGAAASGKEKKPAPLGWGYVVREVPLANHPGRASRKPPAIQLERGSLVQVLEARATGSSSWSKVAAINLATAEAATGWVDSTNIESYPPDAFPPDADLLKELGGAYLEDITASTATVARFLVRQGNRDPALVCFIGSRVLPNSRLEVFEKLSGQFVAGPRLEFPASEMKSGITRLEVLDLLGDGNECLVSEEPFSTRVEESGVNMVIRRIEANTLKTLWRAPLEFRNLASFPPQRALLQPPEKNIGTPGTVTVAQVDFPARGSLQEPDWKGTIEFHVAGREAPVETVKMEKVCAWDGEKFAPIQ